MDVEAQCPVRTDVLRPFRKWIGVEQEDVSAWKTVSPNPSTPGYVLKKDTT
jgi:hypothetical protein